MANEFVLFGILWFQVVIDAIEFSVKEFYLVISVQLKVINLELTLDFSLSDQENLPPQSDLMSAS